MLRGNFLKDLTNCRMRSSVTSLRQFYQLYCVRGSTAPALGQSTSSTSVSLRSNENSITCCVLVSDVRGFHVVNQMHRRLLQMFEDLQKKTKESSQREQLTSSFSIVRGIQLETEVAELLSIYDVLKNYSKVDLHNKTVLYAQVALFHRLASFEAHHLQRGHKRDDRVRAATVHLANVIRWNSHLCEPTHLASTVHGIAALELKDLSYFIHFDKEIRSRNPRLFTNADLAMILWAYGKAQFRARVLYKFIRNEIMARDLATFHIKEICQFLWSYARTLEKGAKLFAVLREEIMKRDLAKLEERSLTIILWSYAEVGLNVKPLFRCIKLEILRRGLASFTHKQMAQITSSYAQQNIRSPDLFQEISAEIINRGKLDFAPVGLVMIVNSFAKTKNYVRDLFKLIETRLLTEELSVYEPEQVIRFLRAFTDAGLITEALFRKLTGKILLNKFSTLNDLCLEELVNALQGSRFSAPELVAKTEAELVRRSESPE